MSATRGSAALMDAALILEREATDLEAAFRKLRKDVPARTARAAAIKRATAVVLRAEADRARATDDDPFDQYVRLARIVLEDAS